MAICSHKFFVSLEQQAEYTHEVFSPLAQTNEKIRQIRFSNVIFRDSMTSATNSLAKLLDVHAKSAPTLGESFPLTLKHHPWLNANDESEIEARLNMPCRNAPFAYSSMRGEACWSLPALLPRQAYNNDRRGQDCSEDVYRQIEELVTFWPGSGLYEHPKSVA